MKYVFDVFFQQQVDDVGWDCIDDQCLYQVFVVVFVVVELCEEIVDQCDLVCVEVLQQCQCGVEVECDEEGQQLWCMFVDVYVEQCWYEQCMVEVVDGEEFGDVLQDVQEYQKLEVYVLVFLVKIKWEGRWMM